MTWNRSFTSRSPPTGERHSGTGPIDPARLAARVVVEPGEGTSEQFPHLYGELPVDAVIDVHEYSPDETGAFPPVG
jgi:hypothetical protein